jgi:hypothetical protein
VHEHVDSDRGGPLSRGEKRREQVMAQWDRFDICEAHCVLEWDFNEGGWLQERPSNKRRMESTGVQLERLWFRPANNLSFDSLTDNGKEIYLDKVLEWDLPINQDLGHQIMMFYSWDWLRENYPKKWAECCASGTKSMFG